jgi:flagellar basal-body rod protein FlgG
MLRALYTSAAGMQSQQVNLDVIANNLANVNTIGFKKHKPEFQDLLYQTTRAAGADQGGGNVLPTGIQIGHGSQLVATSRVFSTGEFSNTGEELDVAINGDGFFEVLMPDGNVAYTRDGALKRSADGVVTTNSGLQLQGGWPAIDAASKVTIAPTGEVTLSGPDGNQSVRVQLVRFANPAGLQSLGQNLYRETDTSKPPELSNPDENGFGQLEQYSLELSNVKVVEEMMNMILTQRAYEVNSKAVQAGDDMMQLSNNLRQ